jgi:arylsulfatase A-like enzyme
MRVIFMAKNRLQNYKRMKRLLILFLLLSAGMFFRPVKLQAQKKNVLFIVVDDLNTELGSYGHKQIVSPHIDKLAGEGVLFKAAFCQWPVCGPSRASFLTGQTPDGTGIRNLKTHLRDVRPDIVTLPQYFKKNGYVTGAIGKVFDHRNVDEQNDSLSWTLPYTQWNTYQYPPQYGPLYQNQWRIRARTAVECGPEGVGDDGYLDGQFCNEALKRLDEFARTKKPFFLAVGFKKPHIPFVAPKKYWDLYNEDSLDLAPFQKRAAGTPLYAYFKEEPKKFVDMPRVWTYNDPQRGDSILPPKYQRRLLHGYYACISYVDAQVGKLLQKLKETGLDKNTIIVLLGDNGYHLGDHNQWGKHTVFEWSARDPLILYRPGDKSGVYDYPVDFVDIFPTLCRLTGLKVPADVQGVDLSGILKGNRNPVKPVAVTEYRAGGHATYSFRTQRYRLTLRFKTAKMRPDVSDWDASQIIFEELYDYQKDSLETRNLAYDKSYRAVRDSLLNLAEQWWKKQYRFFKTLRIAKTTTDVPHVTAVPGNDKRNIPPDVFGFNGKTIGGPPFSEKIFKKL